MINLIMTLSNRFAASCASGDFLGFKSWYHYLDLDRSQDRCEIKSFQILPANGHPSDIPLVLIAVIDDLLRIAGIVAVAFVIVGAIQMITSQGSPDQAANGRSTVVNALVGLAIAMIAVVFVSFLGNKLAG